MSNHVDDFYAAVSVLAGHGHIKQRLIKAFEDNLADIADDELPITLKQPFADIRCQMNRVTPLSGESPVCASVRKMSVTEAAECAAAVVSIYRDLSRLEPDSEAVLPIESKDQKVVPAFLVKSN